jgi:hypothetical protein
MKDANSSSATDLGDTNSDGGGGGGTTRSSSPGSPDMNSLSPPCSGNNSDIMTSVPTALHGTPEGMPPVLSHSRMFRNAPTAESFLAASHTAALLAATAVGGNPLRLPVNIHTTLASGPPVFHHQRGPSIFNWSPDAVSPPPVATTDTSNNNNNNNRMPVKRNNQHVVSSSSSSATVSRKNQANARKRAGRKTEPTGPTVIELAAMTQIAAAPLSPPTSGSYACSHGEAPQASGLTDRGYQRKGTNIPISPRSYEMPVSTEH